MLADALRMYRDSLCPDCGTPAVWAWDPKAERYFQADPRSPHCNVCAIREAKPDDDREPGDKVRVLNTMHDDPRG